MSVLSKIYHVGLLYILQFYDCLRSAGEWVIFDFFIPYIHLETSIQGLVWASWLDIDEIEKANFIFSAPNLKFTKNTSKFKARKIHSLPQCMHPRVFIGVSYFIAQCWSLFIPFTVYSENIFTWKTVVKCGAV